MLLRAAGAAAAPQRRCFNATQCRRSLRRSCPRAHRSAVVACAAPPPELLVLDFERGLSAGGGALHARGLAAALAFTSLPYYILTDAAPDAVAAVFRDAADVDLPAARMFARSAAGLRAVAARPLAASASRVRLVSGDAALLAAAAAEPATAAWALHAATWLPPPGAPGAPPAPAAAKPLPLDALVELLNFGLLMGVGDGCQEKFDAQGNELESN